MACVAIDRAMRSVVRQEGRILSLRQIVWVRPLVVDKEPIEVHITLQLQENQQVVFTVRSQTHKTEDEALDILSQGRAKLSLREETTQSPDLPAVTHTCFPRQIGASECYQRYR